MNREFTDISLARSLRRNNSAIRHMKFLPRNAQMTDAAFAELDSITLRLDQPSAMASGKPERQPGDDLVQQLSGQLKALDQQRNRLARLLNDLQPPHFTVI